MNFDYLKKFPELKKLTGFCNDAEQLVYSRPYLSGMSARQGLEYIVKLIYASKIAPTDGLTMFDMLDDQRFTGWKLTEPRTTRTRVAGKMLIDWCVNTEKKNSHIHFDQKLCDGIQNIRFTSDN